MNNIEVLDQIIFNNHYRKLLIVDGSEQFVNEVLTHYCEFMIDDLNYKTYSKSYAHLGHEYKIVGYNGFNRLNPEMLFSLVGLVQFGGCFILGLKDFANLELFSDQDLDRFRVDRKTKLNNNFLLRFKNLIEASDCYAYYSEKQGLVIKKEALQVDQNNKDETIKQEGLPQEINDWLHNKTKLLLLTGNRGAGKSTLLGKIAESFCGKVYITSPSKASLVNVMQVTHKAEFIGIDQLISQDDFKADLLMIDEVGSIPIFQLKSIIEKYDKIILSGTSDGYEGTANGIKLKLLPQLNKSYEIYNLASNYRNIATDALGTLWQEIFNPSFDFKAEDLDLSKAQIKTISAEELVKDQEKLKAIYHLLATNHYQTQPSDLRQILDLPTNLIHYIEIEHKIIAVVWGAVEEIPSKLVPKVFEGTRRPKGNLIPQTLVAHAGFKNAGYYRFYRIVRIAVLENVRRHHLATKLVDHIYETMQDRFDFLGVSYGITKELLSFWHKLGFLTVKLGMKADHVSGLLSVVMLKARNNLLNRVLLEWYQSFVENMIFQASWQYHDLESELICNMLREPINDFWLDNQYWRDLASIALGHRSPEQAIGFVMKWLLTHVNIWQKWQDQNKLIFIEYFVMHKNIEITVFIDFLRQEMAKTLEIKQ